MKTQKLPILLAVIIFGAIALALSMSLVRVFGSMAVDQGASINAYRVYSLFASTTAETTIATTTTATSTNINAYFDSSGRKIDGSADLRGAKKATAYFTRGGATSANTGTSTFSIQTTRNGTDYDNFSKLITNTANTNSQALTRVATVALGVDTGNGTSTVNYAIDMSNDGFQAARCVVNETTDGEHACAIGVTY